MQNRVSQALPRLPEDVRRFGVTTIKSSPDLLMVVHLYSPDNRYDMVYLRNYAVLQVRDQLARLPGVGEVRVFGAGDYSMRVWLDPQKVASRDLTAGDVVQAIREQNVQVAAGVIGAQPAPAGVEYQLSVNATGRLVTEEEFGNIIIKSAPDGSVTRLRDVARIELGAGTYSLRSLLNNKPAVALPVALKPGANALDLSDAVRKAMQEISKTFPEGVDYQIVYDTTMFVRESIIAVIETLLEAVALVVLVVVLFLQTWRASIIPLLAVPISIVGTFGLMLAFGFSINNLSLFGLVLAIGIVVDDAIVVVENVERNIERGLSPRDAAYGRWRKSAVRSSRSRWCCAPCSCRSRSSSGLTGQFYKQFALTIAISTVISAFNSLTLSPALCAVLLKSRDAKPDIATRIIDRLFGWVFRPFNRLFHRSSERYGKGVGGFIGRKGAVAIVYAALIGLTWFMFRLVPPGFIPTQDKLYLIAFAQLPDAASLDRTEDVIRRMSDIGLKNPGVDGAIAFPGLSIKGFTNSSNAGIVFFRLKAFEERKGKALSGPAIAQSLNQQLAGIQDAYIGVFPPPPVAGLGTLGGFELQIEDRANLGYDELYAALQGALAKAYQTPQLAGVFSSYTINVPQITADVDRVRTKEQGVALTDVFEAMQVYLGSLYVNDFNRFGRTYQVIAQADAQYRARPEDIRLLKTRNSQGQMVPLGSLVTISQTQRARSRAALQRLSRRGRQWRAGARFQQRGGSAIHRQGLE